MTLVVSIEEQQRLLGMRDVIGALEVLYQEEANGRAASRQRSDTLCASGEGAYALKSMDGVVPALGAGAVRVNSDIVTWPTVSGQVRRVKVPSAPGNRYVGLVLLFSTATGEPLGIMPDGYIQRMRVGGTSGLAVRHMARQDVQVLGIIGSGWQAGAQVLAACEVREFEEVLAYSPNRERLELFAAQTSDACGRQVRPAASARDVAEAADVLLCATNSIEPVVEGAWLRPGQHVGCIRHCELDRAVYGRADRVAVHSRDVSPVHVLADEVRVAKLQPDRGWSEPAGAATWSAAPTLAEMVSGKKEGREDDREVTCFLNNIGLGGQFAAVGMRVLELAKKHGCGQQLPTEWFTQTVHP